MKNQTMRARRGRFQRGVAMVEVLVAALILGIGLVGTVAMQARSYAALADAGYRAEAAIQVEKLLGLMNNDVGNLDSYKVAIGKTPPPVLTTWAAGLGQAMPGATFSINLTDAGYQQQVDIEIRWMRRKGDVQSRHQVTSYVKKPDLI